MKILKQFLTTQPILLLKNLKTCVLLCSAEPQVTPLLEAREAQNMGKTKLRKELRRYNLVVWSENTKVLMFIRCTKQESKSNQRQ